MPISSQTSNKSSFASRKPGICSGKLLVIAFDGFRWDYPRMFKLPTFDLVARSGVHADEGLTPAFITKTLPNFWSMATGLHQEKHGIIDNGFYDPVSKLKFKLGNRKSSGNPAWWLAGKPIWLANQEAGRRSGIFFWPGSDVPINGSRPTHWRRYSDKTPFVTRVDTVTNWLTTDLVDLAMVYFNEPDHTGHVHGALSPEVERVLTSLDDLLSYFLARLEKGNCLESLNVLLVSDHGMTDITAGGHHLISLYDYVNKNDIVDIPQAGVFAGIIPKPGLEDKVFNALNGAHPHMKV